MSRGITVSKVRTVKSFFFLSIKFWLNFLTLIYQVDMVLQNNKVLLFLYIIKNKITLLHVTFCVNNEGWSGYFY